MIYQLETLNQAYRVLNDASRLLSSILSEPVEVKIVTPVIPDQSEMRSLTSNIDAALLKDKIIDLVCVQYMISRVRLRQKTRKKECVDARKVATHLLTTYVPGIKDREIAALLNFDRTSVVSNFNRCEELMTTDKDLNFHYNKILKQLKLFL